MSRKKLQKFKEIKEFENVSEKTTATNKEKIKSLTKNKEVILEIGCGRGEYTIELAQRYPNKFFIGVDIQGERIWHGAKFALKNSLKNVHFLRTYAYFLPEAFKPHTISEIWLTFPDPFPKKRQRKKRLTSPKYLKIIKTLLKENGLLHLKTDDDNLYYYSLNTIRKAKGKIIENYSNIYKKEIMENSNLSIKTRFEKKHLKNDKTIKYIKAIF